MHALRGAPDVHDGAHAGHDDVLRDARDHEFGVDLRVESEVDLDLLPNDGAKPRQLELHDVVADGQAGELIGTGLAGDRHARLEQPRPGERHGHARQQGVRRVGELAEDLASVLRRRDVCPPEKNEKQDNSLNGRLLWRVASDLSWACVRARNRLIDGQSVLDHQFLQQRDGVRHRHDVLLPGAAGHHQRRESLCRADVECCAAIEEDLHEVPALAGRAMEGADTRAEPAGSGSASRSRGRPRRQSLDTRTRDDDWASPLRCPWARSPAVFSVSL